MKIRIKIVSIITSVIMLFLMVDNVFAETLGETGESATDIYKPCHTNANGCVAITGYRYTIIRVIDIKDGGFNYEKISNRMYEPDPEKDKLQYSDSDTIVETIKTGGAFFQEILDYIGINKSDFFANEYYILVEVKHTLFYTKSGGAPYKNTDEMTGYAKDLATIVLSQSNISLDKLSGFKKVSKKIPCDAYIPVKGSSYDKYCTDDPDEEYRIKYLELARDNPRFGKRLVWAKDIKNTNVKIPVKKVNTRGESVKYANINFALYNSAGCADANFVQNLSCNTKGNGTGNCVFEVPFGNYWIKETSIDKTGYVALNQCVEVGSDMEVTYVNKTQCELDYEADTSVKNRLALYKTYGFRNLLNFTMTQSYDVCSVPPLDYAPVTDCLKTDQVNYDTETKFNSGNLSDYNDKIIASNTTGESYCLTDFELHKGDTVKYNSSTQIKAGRMVLSLKENEDVAIGTLTKTCYILKNEYGNYNITIDNFITTADYVGNVKLNGIVLNQPENKSEPTITEEGVFKKVEGTVTISYKPNAVYGEKMTGKPCLNPDSKLCTILGYGVASNFKDVTNSNLSFEFMIENGNNKKIFNFVGTGTDSSNISCPYTVLPEIIKQDDDNQNKLRLEFRTIDTQVPFVRDANKNWCYISAATSPYNVASLYREIATCDSDNTVITKYILNRTNSYGYKDGVKQDPIYTIELRPEDIKLIREYNEENQYNDYKVVEYKDKDNKPIIENAFLYSLRQGVLKTYKDNNIEKEARNYGTLTNKLIKN